MLDGAGLSRPLTVEDVDVDMDGPMTEVELAFLRERYPELVPSADKDEVETEDKDDPTFVPSSENVSKLNPKRRSNLKIDRELVDCWEYSAPIFRKGRSQSITKRPAMKSRLSRRKSYSTEFELAG